MSSDLYSKLRGLDSGQLVSSQQLFCPYTVYGLLTFEIKGFFHQIH